MSLSSSDLASKLLELLRRYTAETVFGLVKSILISWGYQLVHAGKVHDPHHPAGAFWYRLTIASFDGPFSRISKPVTSLDDDQIFEEGERWGGQLALLPFEETIQAFTSTVLEWLLTFDFECSNPEKDREKMLKFVRWWGADLGVD